MGAARGGSEPGWDVFISYGRADRIFVRELADALSGAHLRVFVDVDNLQAGDAWDTTILDALDRSSSAVVILSSAHGQSSFQDAELKHLLRLRAERDYRVVPVLLDGLEPAAMPFPLSHLHALNATGLTPSEVAARLVPILAPPSAPSRGAWGAWERLRDLIGGALAGTPTARPSADAPDATLIGLCRQFFAAAGREPTTGGTGVDLLVPEPVVCRDRPTATAVDRVTSALPQGGVGYLVHRNILAPELELRLDHARLHGVPVVALAERVLAAALADGNPRSVLDALTADARASQNLFRTHNSIIDRRFLFGRAGILAQIGTALRDGEHILLSGSRKSGKTSVLNILRQDLDDHPVVSLDLQLLDRRDAGWPARLFADILAAYDRWGAVHFDGDWPADARQPADGLAFRDLLALRREWHLARGPIATMLLLLDELERLLPLPSEPDVAHHFVRATGALRAVGQGNDRWLSIIAADLRPSANRINQLPGGVTSPLFQFFQEIPLPLLDRAAIAEMVQTLARMMGTSRVEEAVIDGVYRRSGGHPWVARTIAGAAWQQRAASDTLAAGDLDRGLEQLDDDDVLGHFFKTNFWADMTALEQDALVQVARGAATAPPAEIRASLRRQGLLVDGAIPIAAFAEWIVDHQHGQSSAHHR
jgi:hypothetical protein